MTLERAIKIYTECEIKRDPKWDASKCNHCPLVERVGEDNLYFAGLAFCDCLFDLEQIFAGTMPESGEQIG